MKRRILLLEQADDVTGACADASLIVDIASAKPIVVVDPYNIKKLTCKDFDSLIISTNTRSVHMDEAYNTVRKVMKTSNELFEASIISKRIDTTFRGNIGAEINAILDTISDIDLVILTPAYPSAGRIVKHGILLVNGIPLELTEASSSLPIKTSNIIDILSTQTDRRIGHLDLDIVVKGPKRILDTILKFHEKGFDIIIIDATNERDLDYIAKAITSLPLKPLISSSGPLTALVAKRLYRGQHPSISPAKSKRRGFVAAIVGSITELTAKQIDELCRKFKCLRVTVNVNRMIRDRKSLSEEVRRIVNFISNSLDKYQPDIIVIETDRRRIMKGKEAMRVSRSLGLISRELADTIPLIGLYLSGGDTALGVFREMGITSIEVIERIVPLVALAKVIEGKYKDLPIITKGGLVGDDTTALICIKKMLDYFN